MSINTRSQLYIITLALSAIGVAAVSLWQWPIGQAASGLWQLGVLIMVVAITGRFPIKLSRQAEASLLIVPLFMAALLIHPALAVGVAAAGALISERLLKAPFRAMAFNMGVNSLAAGLAGIVFMSLSPQGAFSLTQGHMLAAGAAGLTLYSANLLLVGGMLTLRKGMEYWAQWKDTFAFEAIQEGGLLSVGLMGALLVTQAWWGPVIVIIPALLAYYAFHHTVSEAAEKTEMAEELSESLSELKELQAQLIESAKMASVGSLATGIAHEINNPVFAISGRADLLVRGSDKHLASEKAVEYVQTIQEMGVRIATIVRQLMEYAQPAEGKKEVALSEMMEASLSLLGKRAKSVRLIREYESLAIVEGVPAQLQQVFVNLITNATDAVADWGSVTVGCKVEDGRAIGYVKDTGVGIPDEVMARLFEPFVTTKEVNERVGMGLGLYTSHKIMVSHGGEIRVETERGKGTTVWVSMPAVDTLDYELDDDIVVGESV